MECHIIGASIRFESWIINCLSYITQEISPKGIEKKSYFGMKSLLWMDKITKQTEWSMKHCLILIYAMVNVKTQWHVIGAKISFWIQKKFSELHNTTNVTWLEVNNKTNEIIYRCNDIIGVSIKLNKLSAQSVQQSEWTEAYQDMKSLL